MSRIEKKEDDNISCLACGKAKSKDDLGLSCGEGHYIHGGDCLRKYFSEIFQKGSTEMKCPMNCGHEFPPNMIEALMIPEEKEAFLKFCLKKIFIEEELFFGCPFCTYGCIFLKNDVPLFFLL